MFSLKSEERRREILLTLLTQEFMNESQKGNVCAEAFCYVNVFLGMVMKFGAKHLGLAVNLDRSVKLLSKQWTMFTTEHFGCV